MFRFTLMARAGLVLVLSGTIGALSAAQAPSYVPGRLLVKFSSQTSPFRSHNLIASVHALDLGEIPHTGIHILSLPPDANELAVKQSFSARTEIEIADLDYIVTPAQATSTPNDPYYSSEWHLPKIGCPTAWSTTTGSSSVIVAVLDTGCDPTHPDLSPKYVPGWNFYDNNSDTHDVYNHGTPVAGTVAACSNNGAGVASVAWGCKIMPIRITDTAGNASSSAMANGITWAADHGARVANVSFNNVGWLTAVKTAAQYMQSKGGVVVSSAGNSSVALTYADNPYVMTISATDSTDTLCSFSNTGTPIDLAAPGYGIYTTSNGGGYSGWAGTSFSSPIVAGVAALMISANPNLTGQQVHDMLEQSADDLGSAGWDSKYGYGRVNAAKAVALATAGQSLPVNAAPTVATPASASPSTITGKTTSLSVLGADDGGESNLTYTWSATGPAAVSFSSNGTNAAKNATATFSKAGAYTFTASIRDLGGLSVSSSVGATVSQTSTSVTVSPNSATLSVKQSQQYASQALDQFGNALLTQPVFTWSASGGGTIGTSGLYTATTAGGPFTVSAAVVSLLGSGTVTVTQPDTTAPTVSITSPSSGAVSGLVSVTASASDNVGVTRVEFWLDNVLISSDSAAPWSFSFSTKGWKAGAIHTLQCKAYDAAGNGGVSPTVNVWK